MNMIYSGAKLSAIAILGIVCGSLIMGTALQFETYSSLPKLAEDLGSLQRFKSTSELLSYLQNRTTSPMYYTLDFAGMVKASAEANRAVDFS